MITILKELKRTKFKFERGRSIRLILQSYISTRIIHIQDLSQIELLENYMEIYLLLTKID